MQVRFEILSILTKFQYALAYLPYTQGKKQKCWISSLEINDYNINLCIFYIKWKKPRISF